MNEYEKMAVDFLEKHNATMTISFIGTNADPWNNGENRLHNQYRFRIRRNGRSYSGIFTDSVWNTEHNERPSKYDILACMTTCEPDADIWDFASEFGYTIDSKESFARVQKIHRAVKREYNGMIRLFGDCMEELAEIQ